MSRKLYSELNCWLTGDTVTTDTNTVDVDVELKKNTLLILIQNSLD